MTASIAPLLDPAAAEAALNSHATLSYKQAKWMFNLINDKIAYGSPEFAAWRARYRMMTRTGFMAAIEELQALPALKETSIAPTAPGLFKNPMTDKIFRVIEVNHSLHAHQLAEIGGTRLTEAGEFVNFEWQGISITRIDAAWRMTEADEHAYAIRYGRCRKCHRQLKDATSVAFAEGPDCGGRR